MKRFYQGFALSFILYALYVQFDKRMGNIWLRNNAYGNIVFVPHNLISLIISPLFDKYMWNPYLWDINFFIFSSVTISAYIGAFNIRHIIRNY